MIYLDSAATTPVRREVLEAMWPWLTGEFGNASSSHGMGARAAAALKEARAQVAACLGCKAGEVVFTSGGTEADNLAVKGMALAAAGLGRHVVTTRTEHEAVLGACGYLERMHGFAVTYVGVDRCGRVDMEAFGAALTGETALASVMLANNEVGTVEPVAELAAVARARGVRFHTDAVQAAGAMELDVGALGVDAMSLSGHKMGAPKGVGVLFVRGGVALEPVLHGGGQERGRRSGTENVAGAVGFAVALRLATEGLAGRVARIAGLRDELIAGVLAEVPGAMLTGDPVRRLPGNASFVFPGSGSFSGTSGEAVLLQLEERGVLCSSGSACAAGRDEPSHVLLAMGYSPEVAQTAVRFSLGDGVTGEQVAEVVRAVREACAAVQAG